MLFAIFSGIIAIALPLNMLLVVSLSSARGKARDAKRLSDMTQMRTALELYATEHDGKYPVSGGFTLGQGNAQAFGMNGFTKAGVTTDVNAIMPQVSTDPDPAGNLKYRYWSNGKDFVLEFTLERQEGDSPAGAYTLNAESDSPYGVLALDGDQDDLPTDVEMLFGTDPQNPDTDGDGYADAVELQNGFDPNGPGKLKL